MPNRQTNRQRHRTTQNEADATGDYVLNKACLRKRAFDSEALAKACQHDQKAYRCQFCQKWHLSGAANTRRNVRRNGRSKKNRK